MARGPAFLFDLDGTICDSKPGIIRSIRYAMERLERPLPAAEDLDWCVGPPLQDSLAKLLGSRTEVQAALGHYRERYQDLGIYENELYPGLKRALEALASRAPVFVATSKPSVFAREIVRHFGLQALLQGVYGSGLDGSHSDKAELIALLLDAEGLDAVSVTMVGDREHDMVGAVRNGVQGLGVLWGYGTKAALLAAGAFATVKEPSEMPPLLLARIRP
ncbi:MAG TPA: HAD hydrolase-like protein [bacterium]|nr:HAD hydrolase-like protein [bacterium]